MNEPMNHEHKGSAEYERQDLRGRPIFAFLIGLAVMVALVSAFLIGGLHVLRSYDREHQPPQRPLAGKTVPVPESVDRKQSEQGINAAFPEPRLEEDEVHELRGFRSEEEKELASYSWVDQSAGTVRIPIERAMQLIVERGLPTQVKAGVTPPSVVSTARQAAVKADNSGKANKKK